MRLEIEFADIYEEHYRRVLVLCRYLLQSTTGAEDAAQEVFLRAQRKLASYDASRPMSSWLLGIATNYCVDVLRRRNLEKRLFHPEATDSLDPGSPAPGPLGQLLSNERGRDVRRALEALPAKYRVPLVLAYYSEFSYEQIGAALQINPKAVGTLIFRGKRLLREKFERESKSGLSK